jgi:DNA-binding beta-propeller fold protein YncE
MKRAAAACVVAFAVCVPSPSRAQSQALFTYAVFGSDGVKFGAGCTVVDGDVGSNDSLTMGRGNSVGSAATVAADGVRLGTGTDVAGDAFLNRLSGPGTVSGSLTTGLALPVATVPPPPVVAAGTGLTRITESEVATLPAGAYGTIRAEAGSTMVLAGGEYDVDEIVVRSRASLPSVVRCAGANGCTVRVRTRLTLGGSAIGLTGTALQFFFAGTKSVVIGRPGAQVQAAVQAPLATVRLRSSRNASASFTGRFQGRRVRIGSGATLSRGALVGAVCGNGIAEPPDEECDGDDDAVCLVECRPDCSCSPQPGTQAILHSIGPSVLNNATAFGVQIFGDDFLPGAQLELSDETSGVILATLPTNWVSFSEMTALVPEGMSVPTGIERELVAKVINPGAAKSAAPGIGHCATDQANSPIACTEDADCPPGAGTCVTGVQRLTMFNDLVFLNPNAAAVVPAPHGLCDDGSLCQSATECGGIGSGACSAKLYVTPQQRDEIWVYNTGTAAFVDQDAGATGIQGIAVGDNPFHVEILDLGLGLSRAWVVNRFDDAISILDPAADVELARVTGADLGMPGALRMETEVEFNRAGTRAYLSNENLDVVQVLDIDGANLDAPVLVATIDVGVNPRGMATNTADTRLYVANIQSADISVVDIEPGSATENQVLATIAPRATDDIVGGRADGWDDFVISGRAPRGIVFSDAQNALFVTSIGPQTGPRQGVVQTGGAVINPTITVIDAATDAIVAHVALNGLDAERASCTDPELMALDDARNRLYVTCQGSGTVDVLDTADLAAGLPAELAMVSLPLPTDATVPTLTLTPQVGTFGGKFCGAFTSNSGTPCTTDADCTGCPTLVEGLPVACCARNNPIGLHNGPRGIAISADRNTLFVVNQFTTSVSTLDVSPADPALITVPATTSFAGAFGSNTTQRDRRLGQIEFFTDVRRTNISCATCHIDDHQDGVFFEADVRGPRLRRVLSVRSTRDFPPLLQDQLVPDLASFTDIVVHAERGGFVPCTPCIEIGGSFFCFGGEGTCRQTSVLENQQNTLYAKAITFFPNPNLLDDGSFSTAVPLPGGATGDATLGAEIFDQLGCQGCHPEPLFTIDQFRAFDVGTLGAPVRMREVGTPVAIPLRSLCQDFARPPGFDGSSGFTVPTLRGIWDTFPLLLSGSAGLGAVGSEPVFTPCTPGSAGCCAQLASPLNPGGTAVPEQHLEVTTKDAIRAVLTPPLAVPFTGHGTALGLTPTELNALIAYLRSL